MAAFASQSLSYTIIKDNVYQAYTAPEDKYSFQSHGEVILDIASEKIAELILSHAMKSRKLSELFEDAELVDSPFGKGFHELADSLGTKKAEEVKQEFCSQDNREKLIEELSYSIFSKLSEFPSDPNAIFDYGIASLYLTDYQPHRFIADAFEEVGMSLEDSTLPWKWHISIQGDKRSDEAEKAGTVTYTISDGKEYSESFTYRLRAKD